MVQQIILFFFYLIKKAYIKILFISNVLGIGFMYCVHEHKSMKCFPSEF